MLFSRVTWWGIRVITIATFITGIIGNWNDALQTQTLLGLTWQQFAFSLFGITIIGVGIELEVKYKRLKKLHPQIVVKPIVSENKRLILEVTNNGFGGNFSAQARIRKGLSMTDSFELQWETSGQTRYHIDGGGGIGTLLVGVHPKSHEFNKLDTKSPILIHKGELQLLSIKTGQPIIIRLYSWRFDPSSDKAPHYECEIEVTITSEPTLLKPFKHRAYKVEVDGLNLAFNEISDSHN
jgi:hypothetical protein